MWFVRRTSKIPALMVLSWQNLLCWKERQWWFQYGGLNTNESETRNWNFALARIAQPPVKRTLKSTACVNTRSKSVLTCMRVGDTAQLHRRQINLRSCSTCKTFVLPGLRAYQYWNPTKGFGGNHWWTRRPKRCAQRRYRILARKRFTFRERSECELVSYERVTEVDTAITCPPYHNPQSEKRIVWFRTTCIVVLSCRYAWRKADAQLNTREAMSIRQVLATSGKKVCGTYYQLGALYETVPIAVVMWILTISSVTGLTLLAIQSCSRH